MKYLTLLRHAKSSWDHPGLDDHDRPLNERGRLAAPAIAGFLKKTYFGGDEVPALMPAPDHIVSSTAVRAFTTAQYVREVLGLGISAMTLNSRLYLAPSSTLLQIVRDLDENHKHAVIVAHNPGLYDFCDQILARASIPRLPTCTAVIIGFPHEHWGLSDWHEAQLIAYITPKALEKRFPQEFAGIAKLTGEDD